jgi:L-threonylcarbamoyladenylate synthase
MTVDEAAEAIASGGVIGVPTETVYGIAADPRDEVAVARLFELKGRDRAKPIALLGADAGAFSKVARIGGMAAAMGERHWPGPLTLVVPMRKTLAAGVGDGERGTVGIRVPDHPVALELLAITGPLAVTSANPAGGPDAIDDVAARRALGDAVDGYVVGSGTMGAGSTVVDLTVDPPVILRQGPLRLRF